MKKSPFLVVPEYISPLQSEVVVDSLNLMVPQFDEQDRVLPYVAVNELLELRFTDATLKLCELIDDYYGVEVEAVSKHRFTWYPEEYDDGTIQCDNATFTDGKWIKKNNYDFSAILFLSEYNTNPGFDNMYEVYGGKIQYPNFGFSFNPKRGNLIVHPAGDNFTYNISKVHVGDLNIVQVFFKCKTPYNYNLNEFEGDYRKWGI